MSTVLCDLCSAPPGSPDEFVPSEDEVIEYAQWLGIDLATESDLLWIARKGLAAPLPEQWKACKSPEGDFYYFHFQTGDSIWEHPLDEEFKALVVAERKKLLGA